MSSKTTAIVTKAFFGVEDGKIYPRMIEVGEALVGDLADVAIKEKNAVSDEVAAGLSADELAKLGSASEETEVEVDAAGDVEIPFNWRQKKWFALKALAAKISGRDPTGADEARDVVANEEDRQSRERQKAQTAAALAEAAAALEAKVEVLATAGATVAEAAPEAPVEPVVVVEPVAEPVQEPVVEVAKVETPVEGVAEPLRRPRPAPVEVAAEPVAEVVAEPVVEKPVAPVEPVVEAKPAPEPTTAN